MTNFSWMPLFAYQRHFVSHISDENQINSSVTFCRRRPNTGWQTWKSPCFIQAKNQSLNLRSSRMASKCKYCGSSSFGTTSTSGHPRGCHEHSGVDSKHCVFCNSTSYGSTSTPGHPDGCHKHGSDGQHCIYCGSTSTGNTSTSGHPNKCHER